MKISPPRNEELVAPLAQSKLMGACRPLVTLQMEYNETVISFILLDR